MEDFLIDPEYKNLLKQSSRVFSLEDFKKKDLFRTGTSWHIPTQSLIDILVEFSPIVGVGSGYGYTESLAKKAGADIIATDMNPDSTNQWLKSGKSYLDVEKLDAVEAVKKYSDRNVFMAWPPYDNPMAYEVVKAMQPGRFLVYVGEGRYGCTGDDNFFIYLESHFKQVNHQASIPSWEGIYDDVEVYQKNSN